jgi:hypothetical protein
MTKTAPDGRRRQSRIHYVLADICDCATALLPLQAAHAGGAA